MSQFASMMFTLHEYTFESTIPYAVFRRIEYKCAYTKRTVINVNEPIARKFK